MKQLALCAFVCTLSFITGCTGQNAANTKPADQSNTPPPRLKLSELKFASPWIKSCIADEIRRQKIEFADELTRLTCRGYPKAFESFIRNTSGADMLVTSTDGLEQLTALSELDLSDNYIAHVDLSGLKKLASLNLSGNLLQSLDLTRYSNLKHLSLEQNPLHEIKLPQNSQLETLSINAVAYSGAAFGLSIFESFASSTSSAALLKDKRFIDDKTGELLNKASFSRKVDLDFAGQYQLKSLVLRSRDMESLALATFPDRNSLQLLDVGGNKLQSLDLQKFIQLNTLQLDGNSLRVLDLTQNPSLSYLDISSNQSTSIKAIANNKLQTLNLLNTRIPTEDLRALFSSETLSSVTMQTGELLPTQFAPNLTSLTLFNTGQFISSRLGLAKNLTEFTLNGGSIDNLYFSNLENLKAVHLNFSEQKAGLIFSCNYNLQMMEIFTDDDLVVTGQKGCNLTNLNISAFGASVKVDISSLDVEDVSINSDTSYKNLALNWGAKSVTLQGVKDLDSFSFQDVPNIRTLNLSDTSITSFSFKGAPQSLSQFSLRTINIDQLDLAGGSAALDKLDLQLVNGLKRLDLTPVAKALKELTLSWCVIEEFKSTPLNSAVALVVLHTPFEGENLEAFRRATGRDLASSGDLVPLQK